MMVDRHPEYEKAIAWIVREGGIKKHVPYNQTALAGWRVVNLTAALFDKSARDVANDVIEFARAIDNTDINP